MAQGTRWIKQLHLALGYGTVNQRKGWTAVLGRGTVKQRSETSSDWHSRYTSMINRCQRRSWIAPYSLASFSVHFLGYAQWVAQAHMTCQQQKPPCTGTFRWALSYLGCTPVLGVSALCWQWPLFLCVSLPDLWWAFWGACCLLLWQTWGCVAHFFGNHSSVLCSSLTDVILWWSAVLHISLANTALHCTVSSLTDRVLWHMECCVAHFFGKYSIMLHSSVTDTVLFSTSFFLSSSFFFGGGGGGGRRYSVVQFSDRHGAVLHISLSNTALWYTVLWQTQCCVLLFFSLFVCFLFWGVGAIYNVVLYSSLLDAVLCCTVL